MSCPVKYRHLGDFPDYYSGKQKAPVLTIFIAGNHEASSHLWELYYGGWVAPNIYYMGAANVLRLGPIRIAGMSGIWKGFDYRKTHHERLPFNEDDVRSFYHVREWDIRKLLLLRTQVDVGLSHDWPRGIEKLGNSEQLFRKKRDFREESANGTLGNIAAEYVLDRLRPPYWFSAHLHVKYAALKTFHDAEANNKADEKDTETVKAEAPAPKEANPDEIDLDDDEDDEAEQAVAPPKTQTETQPDQANNSAEEPSNQVSEDLKAQLPASFFQTPKPKKTPGQPVPPTITNKEVRFLALDKCLPGRSFLQLCDIQPHDLSQLSSHPSNDTGQRFRLQYDPEWLAITRAFHKELVIGNREAPVPPDLGEDQYYPLIDAEREWVEQNIVQTQMLTVPENFEPTAPPYEPGTPEIVHDQPEEYTSPQTAAFCRLLDIENIWDASAEERIARKEQGPAPMPERDFRGGRGGRGGYGGRGGRGGRGGGRGRGRGRGGRGRW